MARGSKSVDPHRRSEPRLDPLFFRDGEGPLLEPASHVLYPFAALRVSLFRRATHPVPLESIASNRRRRLVVEQYLISSMTAGSDKRFLFPPSAWRPAVCASQSQSESPV